MPKDHPNIGNGPKQPTDAELEAKVASAPLPPPQLAPDARAAVPRVFLPPIRLHFTQVWPDLKEEKIDERTGMTVPDPYREGGQYSLLRLFIINPIRKTAREEVMLSYSIHQMGKWPVKPYERLGCPPGVPGAVEAWQKAHFDPSGKRPVPPFPATHPEDARYDPVLELNYGVIEVIFDFPAERELALEAFGKGGRYDTAAQYAERVMSAMGATEATPRAAREAMARELMGTPA